jgi:hypothetical protein
MGRPPGTTKAYESDPDQFAIGMLDYARVLGLDAPALVAAAACGKAVDPDNRTLKKHRELLKAGWAIQSFDVTHSRDGTISRLRKKEKRVSDKANRRGFVATAIFVAMQLPHLAPDMLSVMARMVHEDDLQLRSFIASLINAVTTDLPIDQCVVKMPPANPITRASAKKDRNAKRMKAARAANGAKTRIGNLSAEKPWEKLGMSRRTWYNKSKAGC